VRDYEALRKSLSGHDAVIHLAWDFKTENFGLDTMNPDNSLMFFNIYRAAIVLGISRVIMASSVHTHRFNDWKESQQISPDRIPIPDSPYGANKVFMETLGRYYATKGLEVVCIRFGGVNSNNTSSSNAIEWLSHRDCVMLVRHCLKADKIPDNYQIIYGVSKNKKRIHDYSNPFGWIPQDDSKDYISTRAYILQSMKNHYLSIFRK
jgi:uronate dehydrogenase